MALGSDDYIAVQSFAAAGLGVAVIPGLCVTHPIPGVEVRQLSGTAPVRRIWAARPAQPFRSPVTSSMIGILQLMAQRSATGTAT